MTVSAIPNFVILEGSGSTGPFPFEFNFYKDSDIEVVTTDLDGIETTLTLK